ncbi:MAG: C1 family peptidase [Planctomycetota bacterium]
MKLSRLVVALCSIGCLVLGRATVAQVDHRRSQSPVKDQANRGTCVAFSICAALETFPGVPTDLSEQLLYATVKRHENGVDKWLRKFGKATRMKAGNVFETYVPLFSHVGTSHEAFLPYSPNPLVLPESVPVEIRGFLELAQFTEPALDKVRDTYGKYGFRAEDCTVLDEQQARDVARIKKELDGGRLAIPVTYSVYGPKWSSADDDGKRVRTAIHPGLMFRYRLPGAKTFQDYGVVKLLLPADKDFATELWAGRIQVEKHPDPDPGKSLYGGHAVTIVGYDAHGFLAKNSWGRTWGDEGYCTILFDYHAAFATRALLIDDVYIRTPQLSPFAQSAALRKGRFRVKVQPIGAGEQARLEFSTWALEPRDPNVEVVEYAVEVRGRDGRWGPLHTQVVRAAGPERRRGMPMQLRGGLLARLRAGLQGRVTVRYGGAQLDPQRPTFSRSLTFGPFLPAANVAVDLQPMR